MYTFPKAMQRLIAELTRLPSIGEKSAVRLAYHLVSTDRALAGSLAAAISEAAAAVRQCDQCFFLTEERLCTICRDPSRDQGMLCVVEKPTDLTAIERTGEYRGLYHVLHGVWAPLRGQDAGQLKLNELAVRLKAGGVREVILATSSTVEGDATALYVARLVNELGIKTSRLAQGVPKGGELEYLDDVTLSRAFAGRSTMG